MFLLPSPTPVATLATWSSSDTSVATITAGETSAPTITFAGYGTTTITADWSSGADDTTVSLTFNKKALTVSGITASNKTYDGNTSATVSKDNAVLTGLVDGDSVSVTAATGTFADKTAGNGKTVNLSETMGGDDLSNYTVTAQGTTTANIAKKALTVSGITASNKTYDGNTSATVSKANASLTGLVSGDSVSVTAATGTFANKTAANGKTVNLSETMGVTTCPTTR